MIIKKTISYTFLFLSSCVLLLSLILFLKNLITKYDLAEKFETFTSKRASDNKIDISLNKEDFYKESTSLLIFNVSSDKFLVIYNKNQIKSFDLDEIKKYFNSVLSKNNSRFFRKLSKYFDVSQVIKMPPLRIEKSMGKLYMNNFDFTADIRDYMNFCIGFLAK